MVVCVVLYTDPMLMKLPVIAAEVSAKRWMRVNRKVVSRMFDRDGAALKGGGVCGD